MTTQLDYLLQYLTKPQVASVIIVSKASSLASIAGSTYVLQDILRDPHKHQENVYPRVMLGVATSDFIHATSYFLGTWPMPKGTQLYAMGSEGTCAAVGFLVILGIYLSPMYNCSLATYYLLQLKYSWNVHKMKSFEKWLHIVPWVLSLIGPSVAASTNSLGAVAFVCG